MYKERIKGVDMSFAQRRILNAKWEDAWTQLVKFLVKDGGSKETDNSVISGIVDQTIGHQRSFLVKNYASFVSKASSSGTVDQTIGNYSNTRDLS